MAERVDGADSTASWDPDRDAVPRHVLATPVQVHERYVILDELGRGGMAVVHAAFDRQLGRRVAIKLMRPDRASAVGRERLLREARALAQLRHPNVVDVFDVGEDRGEVFLAMELVEGPSLRGWLAAAPRSRTACLAMFLGAGRGLAAAHAARLVHRDFKPDNVLVDQDGVPRVADFGLARAVLDDDPGASPTVDDDAAPTAPDAAPATPLATPALTRAGAVVGTPGYMAPEVLRGEPATAASDQFAFAVSLAEALTGGRPFAGDDPPTLVAAIERGKPALGGVKPPWLRAVLARALAARPADRFPSMTALVDALDRRRRAPWVVAGVAAVAAAAVIGVGATRGGGRAEPCADLDATLGGAWTPARKAEVTAAFARSGLAWSDAAAAAVTRRLDDQAAAIVREQRRACRANVRREDAPHLAELRASCLRRRELELGAAAGVLAAGDAAVLERAGRVLGALTSPADCGDVAALLRPARVPAGTAAAAEAAAIEEAVDRARVENEAGRSAEVRPVLEGLAERARALGHRPTEGQALCVLGWSLEESGQIAPAEVALRAAVHASHAGQDDEWAARCLFSLALNVGRIQGRVDEGRALAGLAMATAERAGSPPLLVARAQLALGIIESGARRFDEAERALRQALAQAEAALGPDDPWLAGVVNSLGGIALERGQLDDAEAAYRRGRALRVRVDGEGHPTLLPYDANLAAVALFRGDTAAAVAGRRAVLTARERQLGPLHFRIGGDYLALAEAVFQAGDLAEAVTLARRGAEITAAARGADHPAAVSARAQLAELLLAAGARDEALALAAVLVDLPTTAPSVADHALGQLVLARDELARGRRDAAITRLEGLLETATAARAGDSRALGEALALLAVLLREANQDERARALADRALPMLTVTAGPGSTRTTRVADELARAGLSPGR
ncbi:MAG: serine/threonine-protein kinase [Myxococcales bacterium]|nr:serine/threonine-protein kinase [Myxococcales bacterium]